MFIRRRGVRGMTSKEKAKARHATLSAQIGNATHDVNYKILILGDSGVGKTALLQRVLDRPFDAINGYCSTVGIDFIRKIITVDGAKVQLQIWDTAGQERFRSITRFQYRGTKGLLLVYDVTNKSSFSTLSYWLTSIDREVDARNKNPVPVIILGNKCDLEDQRQVTEEEGRKAADSHFVTGFLESSAKDDINVHEAIERLAYAVTETNDPKLMDSYLTKSEKEEREESKRASRLAEEQEAKGMRRNVSRFQLSSLCNGPNGEEEKPKCQCS